MDEDKLSKAQLEIVRDMVIETIELAAQSMGKMLRVRMKSELLSFGEGDFEPITDFDSLGKFRVHVVKVALRGEIGGAFYFLINSHEVDLINSVSLPESLNPSTNSENRQMKHGFMTEIENMIAALSITEISESLGVELLGGVPEVTVLEGERVNRYLRDEILSNHSTFYVTSVLTGVAVNVSPYFVWMLDENFSEMLKLNIVT